jgi:hypothetical protein
MLSGRRFLDFLERKLREHGLSKYIPDEATLREHLTRFREWHLTTELVDAYREQLKARAAAIPMPALLRPAIEKLLAKHPELPWDEAVTRAFPYPPSKPTNKRQRKPTQ